MQSSGLQVFRMSKIWIWILTTLLLLLGVEGQDRSPWIKEHPKDVLLKRNEPTTLNCRGEGNPKPTIEWYKDGILLNNNPSNAGGRLFLPHGDLFFLSVSDEKKEADSGNYWCVARNSVGSARSRNASLQVGVIRDDFRDMPQNTKVLVGDTATLKCQPPRGVPEPQVLWQKNGQTLDMRLTSSRLRSADGGNLIIKDVRATDAGKYQCLGINIAGTKASVEVTLTVQQKPYFKEEPKDITVLVGDPAIFTCEVDGLPSPTLAWHRQDAPMPQERAERIPNGLKIKDARPEDEGLYFCQASNDQGSVRASALLSVHSKPKFMMRPRDVRAGLNEVVKLECSAIGNPPPTTYWRKEGSQELFFPSSTQKHFVVNPEGALRFPAVRKEDSGHYVCSALSAAGSSETMVQLEVTSADQAPPPIINIGPSNQTLPLKSMASLPCEVIAPTPNPTIKWLKDASSDFIVKNPSSRITVSPNGTLQINDLRAEDSGLYTCVASSPAIGKSSETSRSASLSVESPTNPNIAFRRTNPSLLPLPPSKPTMIANETTATSLTLSWTWTAKQAPARNQPLLGFTLESFSPDSPSGGWVTLGHRIYGGVGEASHTVDRLKPNTRYIFFVRAESMEGFSAASPVSDVMRTRAGFGSRGLGHELDMDVEEVRSQLGSSDIELISSEPASSTSIRISWKISKQAIKYIDGYYVRYREIATEPTFLGFNILTVVAQKSDAYLHVIPNLKKFSQYEVFVSPFYASVEGQPSNSRMVITSEDKPSAPPQNLSAKAMNASASSVRWAPPPNENLNGVLTGYRVEVRGNDSVRIHAEMDFGPNITSIVLNNLTLGRSYLVRVAGFTSVGSGPFTAPLPITMDLGSLAADSSSSEENGGSGLAAEDGASQILKEVWFIILMGVLLFIFLLLLIIILYSRRKSHGKKDHISSVVVAPHSDSQFESGKQHSLWIDQRWRPTDVSDKDSSRSEAKLLSNGLNGDLSETQDYAEVDPHNLTTFYNNSNKGQQMLQQQQQPDLTPYATTTLIQRRVNYDPLPINGGPHGGPHGGKGPMDNYRDLSDQFSSGRSKLSMSSNNFNKFKSSHPSPSPSPSAPMRMVPVSSRIGCYPSPGPHRSHMVPLEKSLHHPYSNHHAHTNHANENLYHIGEIFTPNKSASATNGFSEAVYQSGDPEDSNFLPQQTLCPLIDREIQSSLPSLASDSTSCNLYAEADDVIPMTTGNNYILSGGGISSQRAIKNSRSTSPAYSSDSFSSGKSGNKRLYKGNKKKFDNSCKSLERRHLAPLLPSSGRTEELPAYSRTPFQQNGFQKLPRFQRPTISNCHLNNDYHDWQNDASAMKLATSLKESNA